MAPDERKTFDVLGARLDGTSLIEASAGTGKTWTIAALYARLVLERDVPVDGILVVTFTIAATAELRERIRARLTGLREAFVRGRAQPDDAFAHACLAHFEPQPSIERLTRALTAFDLAAIHTIHAFCQRVLSEQAFESAMPFRTDILPDESEVLREVLEDFWRRELYPAPEIFVRYVRAQGLSPAALAAAIAPHLGKSYLILDAPPDPGSLVEPGERLRSAYRAAQTCWRREREAVLQALADHPNGSSYRPGNMPGRIDELDAYLAHEEPPFAFPGKGVFFTASKVEAAAKGKDYPKHPFFALCQALADATEAFAPAADGALAALQKRAIEYARVELARRKAARGLQSYDDLLNNLARALTAPSGDALARALRARYAAALIDEFQDTDPVQYGIFRRIYGGSAVPVFFVGDPKQAIYSFRGADVYAYLQAKAAASEPEPLRHNWRSTPMLIDAVNALYAGHADPFLLDEIPFIPAEPAPRACEALEVQGDNAAALRFWLFREAEGASPKKDDTGARVVEATAGEIVRLLELGQAGRARIGERPLGGGDVAILVRTHRQAELVKRALRRRGVASVEYSQESVFASREALELERVLMAAAAPGREALVRAALATEMLGASGTDIEVLRSDEAAWQERLEAFHVLHVLWREHGFIRMFRTLLARYGVPARLLGYPDGERRLTNLGHLAELLQAQSRGARGGMEGLILWLAERRRAGERSEEAVLRLESDEHLVKIVTVHAAKGLEYPVVFCPFLWDGSVRTPRKGETLSFHDPERGNRAVLDLGTERRDERARLAQREEFAENLRLAYVALTRAEHRCYVPWGRVKNAECSALAWLLHGQGLGAAPDLLEALKQRVKGLSDAELEAAAKACAARAPGGAIVLEPLPEPSGVRFAPVRAAARAPAARPFHGSTAAGWRIGSFSGLAARALADAPDYDEVRDPERLPPLPDDLSIHAFPRGTRAGTCLHAVFQRLDFSETDPKVLEPLVVRTLREFRFTDVWAPAVCAMVHAVLGTALDGDGLRLSHVARTQRIDEMEFHYPVARLDSEGLKRVLARHDFGGPAVRAALGRLSFDAVRGFMKGYVDLVFEAAGRYYLVDYKSNWLGPEPGSYGADALEREVAEEAYYLQYLLYTVALHRYLGARLPGYDYERHFGGAYYLFLRGMDPARGNACGVYHDRPSAALVAALDAWLRGTDEEGHAGTA